MITRTAGFPSVLPARRGFRGRRAAAFSLVEVCMALGLVAFCLVALSGLLQAGLQQERLAMDQARAAHILGQLADEFRGLGRLPEPGMVRGTGENRFGFRLPAPGQAASEPSAPQRLGDRGEPVTTSEAAFVFKYRVVPPSAGEGAYAPHKVRIIIAWPASAEFTGSGDDFTVQKARGSLETTTELNDD